MARRTPKIVVGEEVTEVQEVEVKNEEVIEEVATVVPEVVVSANLKEKLATISDFFLVFLSASFGLPTLGLNSSSSNPKYSIGSFI